MSDQQQNPMIDALFQMLLDANMREANLRAQLLAAQRQMQTAPDPETPPP